MVKIRTAQAQPPYYGEVLKRGSRGPDVALVQSWLTGLLPDSRIGKIDGAFGSATETAVKRFQTGIAVQADGRVGDATWEALYLAWAAQFGQGEIYPGIPLTKGTEGAAVKSMQTRLGLLAAVYPAIPGLEADGRFGGGTREALRAFQLQFSLEESGSLAQADFELLVRAAAAAQAGSPLPVTAAYGGRVLAQGAVGTEVRCAQSWLAALTPCVPAPTVDGRFGLGTRDAVIAFQGIGCLGADGKIGRKTWDALVNAFNETLKK